MVPRLLCLHLKRFPRFLSNAILYQNGSKGVGHLHTSLALNGVWDLVWKKPESEDDKKPPHTYDTVLPRVKWLMTSWEGLVLELTREQARTPWFEMRPGHATGTTFYQWLCVSKFILLNDASLGDDASTLLELLGMNITKQSVNVISKKNQKQLKNAYKALGYTYTNSTTNHEMERTIHEQIPTDAMVFQHIVRSLCMTPIKRKSKHVSEAFRQGHLAEIKIAASLNAFLMQESSGAIVSTDLFNVSLLKNKLVKIAAVSPDGIGVVTCAWLEESDQSVIANDMRKLFGFFESQDYLSDFSHVHVPDASETDLGHTLSLDDDDSADATKRGHHSSGSNGADANERGHHLSSSNSTLMAPEMTALESERDTVAFVSAFEFKHHSSVLTLAETTLLIERTLSFHDSTL